jgi:hypothetical protein
MGQRDKSRELRWSSFSVWIRKRRNFVYLLSALLSIPGAVLALYVNYRQIVQDPTSSSLPMTIVTLPELQQSSRGFVSASLHVGRPVWDALEGIIASDFDLKVSVEPRRSDYRIGDRIRFLLRPERDCYVNVLNLGTDGTSHLLFPNAHSPNANFIANGDLMALPDRETYSFEIAGPEGEDRILILATSLPVNLLTEQPEQAITRVRSPFLSFSDSGVVTRSVQIVSRVAEMNRSVCIVRFRVVDTE